MIKFTRENFGKKVELEIHKIVDKYKCIATITVDSIIVGDNVQVGTGLPISQPNLYCFKFISNVGERKGKTINLIICDLDQETEDSSVEDIIKNRQITDFIWENMRDRNYYDCTYPYTTDHWSNWED